MKLKTIKLKGRDYVQVNERVSYFNDTYKDGMITTEPTFQDDTVYFKATIHPDAKNKERFYTGHSFGSLKGEKALEKLETVAVGRALAFMGIGIVDSIASADEMQKFQAQETDEMVKIGFCNVCGQQGIKAKTREGRIFYTCPNWKEHKDNGEKWELVQKNELSESDQEFVNSLPV